MKFLDPIVNPVVNTTKKTASLIGIGGGSDEDARENSPLLQSDSDASSGSETPTATAPLPSLSEEYKTFMRSRNVLLFCAFHMLIFYSVAVIAYSFYFERWNIIDSLYFATVTFLTIGYGDLSPSTDPGRFFTIFFALYGIGILGTFVSIIGGAVVEAGHEAMANTEARAKKRILAMFSTSDDADDVQSKSMCREISLATLKDLPFIALLFIFAILLGLPEGRSVVSSLYFAVITATTVGFGDLHPSSTVMRAICILYLPFSVAVFGQVLTSIGHVYIDIKAEEAEKAFLERKLALRDLKAMDVDGDGKVSYGEFLSFILVAMDKVDKSDLDEIRSYFNSLDVDNNGYLEKADLAKLASEGTSVQLTESMRRMGANAAIEQRQNLLRPHVFKS